MVRRKPVSLIFRNATMPSTEPANSAGRLVDHDLGRKAGAFQQKVGCRVRHGPHACQSYGSGGGGLVSVMHIASSSDAANAAGPVVGLACERSSMMLLTRWRTRARAAAMASGRILGALECPLVGVDEGAISVGISTAFFFIFEIQESTRGLASKIFCYQMAIVKNQMSCLAAPRNMKRLDNAREQTLAFHEGIPCFTRATWQRPRKTDVRCFTCCAGPVQIDVSEPLPGM